MLLNKGKIFFDLVQNPLAMSLIEFLIGPDYLISCVDAQIQHPGAGTMPLHTDQWWMPARPGLERRHRARRMCSATLGRRLTLLRPPDPLVPSRPPTSCGWSPTSRRKAGPLAECRRAISADRFPDPSVPHKIPSVPAIGPAGTAFAFDARLWHGAAPNRTQNPRYGITVVGCGPQFRPLENYSRGLRPEVFEHCPLPLLRRLGFAAWSGYGHTGDPDAAIIAAGEHAMGELHKTAPLLD